MNVFATLKTVFFGSKFLSGPVPSDGTPRRDLVSALNGLMPLCRTMPGVHLAVDIREGRVALVLDWTPRTDGNALTGSYHYIVSDEDGVKEVDKSQVLLAENGEGNLLESRDGFSGCLVALTEETEEESVQLENVREVMNPIHSKDIKKEAAPISPEETVGKAKSRSLMQEVTTFLTFHYHFCFNVLTEVTEVACLENDVPDPHLHYAKVLQTRTRRGVFRLCFRFAMVEDDLQKVLTFSVTQLFGRMKSIHPSVIRSMTAYSLSRILPLLGGCILSKGMYIG